MEAINGRRTKFDVIAEILRLEGKCTREIMDTANLSHAQLQHYLPALTEGGFIVHSPGHKLIPYRLTSEGRDLLKRIEALQDFLAPYRSKTG